MKLTENNDNIWMEIIIASQPCKIDSIDMSWLGSKEIGTWFENKKYRLYVKDRFLQKTSR